jgi:Holliday junction resolvase RusA-like endonuclease
VIAFWSGRAISENQRLAPGRDRFTVNQEYQAFKESIAWVCKAHMERFDGPVAVRLFLVLNPRMDAQNVVKPVLDALELAGVIRNDRQVRTFSFYREDRPNGEKDDRIGILVQEAK